MKNTIVIFLLILVGSGGFIFGGIFVPPEIIEVEVEVEKIVEVPIYIEVEKEPTVIDMISNPTGFIIDGILDTEHGIFSEENAQRVEETEGIEDMVKDIFGEW